MFDYNSQRIKKAAIISLVFFASQTIGQKSIGYEHDDDHVYAGKSKPRPRKETATGDKEHATFQDFLKNAEELKNVPKDRIKKTDQVSSQGEDLIVDIAHTTTKTKPDIIKRFIKSIKELFDVDN